MELGFKEKPFLPNLAIAKDGVSKDANPKQRKFKRKRAL